MSLSCLLKILREYKEENDLTYQELASVLEKVLEHYKYYGNLRYNEKVKEINIDELR